MKVKVKSKNKALKDHGQQLVKSNAFDEKCSLPSDKQKEIFCKIVGERLEAIQNLHNTIDFNNLAFYYKGPIANVNIDDFVDVGTFC